MDRNDTDMMDSDASAAAAAAPPPPHGGGSVGELVTLARHLISQGQPSQALQAVLMASRMQGGDEAVILSLNRARELYVSRLQQTNTSSVDQLAALFAECAIAEVEPTPPEPSPVDTANPSLAPDTHGNPILAETGRMQIVLDAFSDGSSFICLQCGGLVSIHRKDEHYAYWCCKI